MVARAEIFKELNASRIFQIVHELFTFIASISLFPFWDFISFFLILSFLIYIFQDLVGRGRFFFYFYVFSLDLVSFFLITFSLSFSFLHFNLHFSRFPREGLMVAALYSCWKRLETLRLLFEARISALVTRNCSRWKNIVSSSLFLLIVRSRVIFASLIVRLRTKYRFIPPTILFCWCSNITYLNGRIIYRF